MCWVAEARFLVHARQSLRSPCLPQHIFLLCISWSMYLRTLNTFCEAPLEDGKRGHRRKHIDKSSDEGQSSRNHSVSKRSENESAAGKARIIS